MSQNNQWGQQPQPDQWGQQQQPQDQWGQQQQPQQQWGPPPQQPYYAPPKKSGCLKWGLIVGGLVALLCVGGGVAIFFFGKGLIEAAQKPLNAFMEAGKANNMAGLKAQLSSTSPATQEELDNMLSQRALFEDYKELTFPTSANASAESGRQSTIDITGKVLYTSGPDATYRATLVLEGEEWKIYSINIQRR